MVNNTMSSVASGPAELSLMYKSTYKRHRPNFARHNVIKLYLQEGPSEWEANAGSIIAIAKRLAGPQGSSFAHVTQHAQSFLSKNTQSHPFNVPSCCHSVPNMQAPSSSPSLLLSLEQTWSPQNDGNTSSSTQDNHWEERAHHTTVLVVRPHRETLLIRPQNTHLGVQRKSKWPRLSPRQPRERSTGTLTWERQNAHPVHPVSLDSNWKHSLQPCLMSIFIHSPAAPGCHNSLFLCPVLDSQCLHFQQKDKRPPPLGKDRHVSSQKSCVGGKSAGHGI